MPEGAQELAEEWTAARSRGVARSSSDATPPSMPSGAKRSRNRCPTRIRLSDLDDAEVAYRRPARRRALSRRHPAPALHLLPPRPAGDPADRAGAAHRLRPHGQADRPRLPGERSGDGTAHHARQGARRGNADVPFETPGAVERAERLGRRCCHDLPHLQRRLFGGRRRRPCALCEEAIRLARLLLRLFQSEPEIMGLTALLLLQHARMPARLDAGRQRSCSWKTRIAACGTAAASPRGSR